VTRVQGLIKDVLATTPDEIDQDVFEPGMLTSMPLIELRDRAEFTVDYRYVSRAQLSRRLCRQQVRPHERHVRPMNCDGHVARSLSRSTVVTACSIDTTKWKSTQTTCIER
jgi:hypothetical protein